jgi:hypothetical protein
MNQRSIFLLAVLAVPAATAVPAAGQTRPAPFRLETLRLEPAIATRVETLAAELGAGEWPRPEALYVAPAVDRSLVVAAESLGPQVRACTTVRFGAEPWGRCSWSWKELERGPETSATGSLDLQVTLAPGARAAQELLLSDLADNMMMVSDLARAYRAAERPIGIGDLAFVVRARTGQDARMWFVRSNVVFRLRGHGTLTEALRPLARRLDDEVLAQPPLTREELLGRRPVVQLGSRSESGEVAYTVRLPGGGELVAAEARIDGQPAPAPAGKVLLGARRQAAEVEVVAVTSDLLASSAAAKVESGGKGY